MGRRTPAWLFTRMTWLAREIAMHIVAASSVQLAMQAGVTTTVTGALEQGLCEIEHEVGVYSQGVKGAVSRKDPCRNPRTMRTAVHRFRPAFACEPHWGAKSTAPAVQDGYQLYYREFFFFVTAGLMRDNYFTNNISRYVGSGQISCGVSTSISSPVARSFAIAGTILSRMYFACFSAEALLL
jgi:hypothetical protein